MQTRSGKGPIMKRNGDVQVCLLFTLLVSLYLCPQAFAGEHDPGVGLSSHGGDHDFAFPREKGVSLTSEMAHIRLAWSNPTYNGFIKGGAGSVLQALERGTEPAYGEAVSPILSEGVLVVSWSQPAGDVAAAPESIQHRYYSDLEVNKKMVDTYLRIDADWHTLAMDAASGETLWHRVEPSASINFLSNKRDHNGITGAARDGVYVTITILGHVYAYDLKTGTTKWTATLEAWNQRAEAFKAKTMEEKSLPYLSSGPFGNKRAGAVIVDGIVVLPDLAGGLLGLKVEDGTRVWHAENLLHDRTTPRPWIHAGKTWLVTSSTPGRGKQVVHLLDPTTGETKWSHETGANPGQLLMGEGYLFLNTNPKSKDDALLTCYALRLEGLEELWTFKDMKKNGIQVKADFGAHRKGVIRDGILYAKLGAGKGVRARMAAIDLESGKERHAVSDPTLGLNVGQPFIAEDKLYVQLNSAHGGGKAGLYVYQLEEGGRFSYLGDVLYKGAGVDVITEYENPIEYPYAGGMLYVRANHAIAAIDLREVTTPMADVMFHGLWAGFHRPLKGIVVADASGAIQFAKVESPPRDELGVVGTTAYRSHSWMPIQIPAGMEIGSAFETGATFRFVPFSWKGAIRMDAQADNTWTGTWSRHLVGWEEPQVREGTLHETSQGGYTRRGWPTGWLKDQPVTFFSSLPEGQQRVFLQLHGVLPPRPGEENAKNLTLCLDHDGERVVAGVGGAFSYNQSYHEVECGDLRVTDEGMQGTAVLILNPDPWVEGDLENGGALAGRLVLDLTFGKPDGEGLYPVRGTWRVEWGIEHTRSGAVEAILQNTGE